MGAEGKVVTIGKAVVPMVTKCKGIVTTHIGKRSVEQICRIFEG